MRNSLFIWCLFVLFGYLLIYEFLLPAHQARKVALETSGGFVLFAEEVVIVVVGWNRCFDGWPMDGQGLREDVLVLNGLIRA